VGARISVIIIAYNEEKYISNILKGLSVQTLQNFEVIVVDSNSSDQTEKVAKDFAADFAEFSYVKLNETIGPAHGRNQGAAAARYDRLLFFDADTTILPHFIATVTAEMEKRQLDLATCPIRILEGDFVSNLGAYFLNAFMYVLKPLYSAAYGACFISNKRTHELVGGFDETLGICEDCNYLKKARRKHGLKFGILSPYFFTSDRRAKSEGGLRFMFKYIRIHLYRMLTGKEVTRKEIVYSYGIYE